MIMGNYYDGKLSFALKEDTPKDVIHKESKYMQELEIAKEEMRIDEIIRRKEL